MKKLYFLLFTLCLILSSRSQNVSLVYANSVGSTGSDEGRSVATDASDNVYAIGKFSAIADFDPSAATVNMTPIGVEDVYIAKYNAAGQYVWAFQIGSSNSQEPPDWQKMRPSPRNPFASRMRTGDHDIWHN